LRHFGSAAAALRASPNALHQIPHIGEKTANDMHSAFQSLSIEEEIARMEKHGVGVIALGAPEYPAILATIADPPHLLYCRGKLLPQDAKAVAVVGSRHCTAYGRRAAAWLVTGLVRAGYTVVSGLARGIDGAAHQAALKAGGRTVAVLAGGLSKIYPPEHAELAGQVSASGALLSETKMMMEPMAGMFPARNRIISGLSRAVVIVEAADRSGALITASHAAVQGRPVMAVPGPVDSAASGGTNALIRKGAILVRDAADILEELEGIGAATAQARVDEPASPPPVLDEVQRRVWEFLAEQPRHLDEMAQQLSMSVPSLSGTLLTLEMKRVVRRLPGNRYERWITGGRSGQRG
jgi:DNA processing protein